MKPNRVMASSRTWVSTCKCVISGAEGMSARVRVEPWIRKPTRWTSMTAVVSSRVKADRRAGRSRVLVRRAAAPPTPRAGAPSKPSGWRGGGRGKWRLPAIGGVGATDPRGGEKTPDHHLHLLLLSGAGADHGDLHGLGAVFGDRDAGLGGASSAMARA